MATPPEDPTRKEPGLKPDCELGVTRVRRVRSKSHLAEQPSLDLHVIAEQLRRQAVRRLLRKQLDRP